jgi:DNA-binding transcriptional MerR regulator
MKIGDFARLAGVSRKTLRLYDERGIFSPAARNPVTGYREYHERQLEGFMTALALREAGVPLKDLKAVTSSWRSAEQRVRFLERARQQLRKQMAMQERVMQWIEAELETPSGSPAIVVRRRSGFRIASLRSVLGDSNDAIELERQLLAMVPECWRGNRRGTLWHRCAGDGGLEAESFVEVRTSAVPLVETRQLDAAVVACAFTDNDEHAANRVFEQMKVWLHRRHHTLSGTKRELFWGQALEVQFPIECTGLESIEMPAIG